jgi:type IV secretory pathway VirB4 component
MRPPPAHRATTAHLQSLYPFVAPRGIGSTGPLIGLDLLGGHFHFDPWHLYRSGVLTNPNLLVLGQLGRGKSSFIKTFVWRQIAFGRRAWILDPKGEYGPLARACGVTPLHLMPGGDLRLNPLDVPTANRPGDLDLTVRTRGELISSLASASLGRSLAPAERTAVELAVRTISTARREPVLSDLVEALLDPDPQLAATVRTDSDGLAADGRTVALEMRRLVEGDLAGMFDGRSSVGMDSTAPVVVLDLSAVFASPGLPLLMLCATAWLQAALAAGTGVKRLVVVDEAWAILQDLSTARWLQSAFKLSRSLGVANLVVVHRLSDLRAAGSEGSAQQKLAEGLLADSETRVVFRQSPAEAKVTSEMLGLNGTECDLVRSLPRGVALWKVGASSHVVEHALGAQEWELIDTDAAMVDPIDDRVDQ